MKTARYFFIFCFAALSISAEVSAQAKAGTLPPGTYHTIFEMLKEVPGLEVTLSNDKTGGKVVIRGIGSLRNQQNPLIVVDGVIYGGDLSSINPQDVDGISVLKDAASAGAYGAQGAAGVIMINTKKGKGVDASQSTASVATHTESAYTYFIDHKTTLKVFGLDDKLILEGIPQKQKDDSLVFIIKRKEVKLPIVNIKRVEMVMQ